jgi:hypothetical protein
MGERQVLIPRTKVTVVLRQSQNLVIAAKQVNSECARSCEKHWSHDEVKERSRMVLNLYLTH